ncbi:MAG: type IV pilus modification protein PilV [Steroidobacteraceae bacterium]
MLITYHHPLTPRPSRQAGVGLIEVLIAVLVLSIGMLGMAGLQTWALRNNQSASQRSLAVVQAYYIADVMRTDRVNAVNNGFNLAIDADPPSGTSYIAQSLTNWRANLHDALGADATGSVDCNGPLCDIVVRWDDSRATDGNTQQEISIRVEL